MHWWQVTAAGDAVVALAYFAISYAVLSALAAARELTSNRLGLATGAIFFSCAVGHGLHTVHALLPLVGVSGTEAQAGRASALHDAAWAVVTAAVAVWYWTLRRSYGRLLQGGGLYDDLAARQREAVEVNDGVVQSLVAAKLARSLGRDDDLDRALDGAIASARELVGRLMDDASQGRPARPGDFVRRTPART